MRYNEFEKTVSPSRLRRYVQAASGDKQKATSLYRHNIIASKEVFVVIAYFEIALRNKIDNVLSSEKGPDWLRDSVLPGGLATMQYNHAYIFNMLDHVNKLRNRIAHHEPICFDAKQRTKATTVYIEKIYNEIMTLFAWMGIDGTGLLYGVNHAPKAIKELKNIINRL